MARLLLLFLGVVRSAYLSFATIHTRSWLATEHSTRQYGSRWIGAHPAGFVARDQPPGERRTSPLLR